MNTSSRLIFLILIITSCNGQEIIPEQTITKEMVLDQEKLANSKPLIKKIELDIKDLYDSIPVKKIKSSILKEFKYLRDNKKDVIENYRESIKEINDKFNTIQNHYTTKEEKTKIPQNTYNTLINNNHLNFRDTLQNNVTFSQHFRDSVSYLVANLKDYKITRTFGDRSEIISGPHYPLNTDSEGQMEITNIYYHDSEEKNVPIAIEPPSFSLSGALTETQMKHVDSIDIHFTIKYLTQVDTIRFTKEDIGKEKNGITLLKMKNNSVKYATNNYQDYYGYYKGEIIAEDFYNNNNNLLRDKHLLIVPFYNKNTEKYYQTNLDYYNNLVSLIKGLETREEIYNTLKYIKLKTENEAVNNTQTIFFQRIEGNISSLKLYIAKKRDSISFTSRFKNSSSISNLYLSEFENKTEIIDKNGKLIFSFPFQINFIDSNNNYFKMPIENKMPLYCFLDKKNSTYIKLPYKQLIPINASLLIARKKNNKYILLSTVENKLLNTVEFENYNKAHYNYITHSYEKVITITKDNKRYYLYNQDEELIGVNTKKQITNITLKEIKK